MFDDGDPRVTGDYVRRLPGRGTAGDVILVGVVHGHPASTYRVRTVVERIEPAVLALELPPLAVPLFERYAADDRTPPAAGGEMSAAVQAAPSSSVAGIDGPTPAFLGRLAGTVYRSDVDRSTVRRLLGGVVSVIRHAVRCRVAATVDGVTAPPPTGGSPADHDCDWADPPDEQATDERTQIRRAQSIGAVFGEPGAVTLRDATREAHMADRLATLRREGTVVAIVGVDHLDPLAERLA